MLLRIGVGVGCRLGFMRRQNNGVARPWESTTGAHVGFREGPGPWYCFSRFHENNFYTLLLNSSLPSELLSLPSLMKIRFQWTKF